MKSLPAGADRGGVTVAGAKEIAAENIYRKYLTFQNTSDTAMRVTENGVPATATTGYLIAPGAAANIGTYKAVSVYCSVAGKTYASTEG